MIKYYLFNTVLLTEPIHIIIHMERQVALLESSVDFLKEKVITNVKKVKASDLARNNIENKIVML